MNLRKNNEIKEKKYEINNNDYSFSQLRFQFLYFKTNGTHTKTKISPPKNHRKADKTHMRF